MTRESIVGSRGVVSWPLALTLVASLALGCGTHDGGSWGGRPFDDVSDASASDAAVLDAPPDASFGPAEFIEHLRSVYAFDPGKTPPGSDRLELPSVAPPSAMSTMFPLDVATSVARDDGKLKPVFDEHGDTTDGRAFVVLPERADSPVEVRDIRSGLDVSVVLAGASSSPAEVWKGYVVYRNVLDHGVSVVHVPKPKGTEDWLTIENGEAAAVSYRITLGDEVKGLRLFDETLELLDAAGMPRLRLNPPYLLGADLQRREATLSLSECQADLSNAPPWSHEVTPPGAKVCTVTVRWEQAGLAYPALLDPSWTTTVSMARSRMNHIAGALDDGTVIVAGGVTSQNSSATILRAVERFKLDASGAGAWTVAAPMLQPRMGGYGFARGGRFYAVQGASTWCSIHAGAEYFDVLTGTWTSIATPTTNPPRARAFDGSASMLTDGRILLAGGTSSTDCGVTNPWTPRVAVDFLDTKTLTWSRGPDLPGARAFHSESRLANGQVLIAGGQSAPQGSNPAGYLATTSLYEPLVDQWFSGPTLNYGRRYHGAAVLSASATDVVVFGGVRTQSGAQDPTTYGTTERWTGGATFRLVSPGMVTRRHWSGGLAWSVLDDGSVLAASGVGIASNYLYNGEVFNPASETWSSTGPISQTARVSSFTITPLIGQRKALVAGGLVADAIWLATTEAQIYSYPANGDGGTDGGGIVVTSQSCGDGVRSATFEECDRGTNVSPRSLCSADCRVRDIVAIDDQPMGPPVARQLGEGRHPLAAAETGAFAVVFAEPDASPLRLGLSRFDANGVASDTVIAISNGSTPVLMSNPVVAAVPNGAYAVAYTDMDGDGDELGVALRLVVGSVAPGGAPAHANSTTKFSQYDADLIATPTGLVAAWLDDSNAATAPDIKWRAFDFDLQPTSTEQSLASSDANEGDVALAAFGTAWAAAWRAGSNGQETVEVQAGPNHWSVGPFAPGPVGDRPALVGVDATHWAVFFSQGVDVGDAGFAAGSKLRAALLDTASTTVAVADVAGLSPGAAAPFSQSQVSAAWTGGQIQLAWRTSAEVGNSLGEEVWLKSIAVNAGGGGALDLSAAESPLPRWRAHRAGDQRRPTVIAGGLPSRPEVLALFEDLGRSYHVRAEGLVAVEAIAAPMLRLGESSCDGQPDGASCTDGNRCNGSEACQNGQCVTVGPALVCNDNNRCTSDTCSSTLGCVYARADITCAAFDAPHRLAATISASSSAAGNPAVNAGDNDAATIWLASSTSSTSNNIAWIQLDFGAPKQLEQLRWTAGSGTPSLARSPANYVVETSLDATTWNLVVARTTAGVAQGLEFVGKIARYVRLSTTKVFDGLGSALSFFEIYGEGHDYQSGDLVKWQVFDDFNQPLSTDQWEIQRVGAGVASTASGKLTVDATAAASASMLLTTSSVRGRTVHVRNMHEAPGSGRCWYIGYLNSAVRKGVVLRRDLNPNYVPAAVQANMFFHVLSDAPQYVDLGPFGAGPGLDMTFGFYGNTIQVDVSKDGAFLSRQTTDASFLPSEVRFALVDYCGAKITVDDLLASP